jgi:hypothetical protein
VFSVIIITLLQKLENRLTRNEQKGSPTQTREP